MPRSALMEAIVDIGVASNGQGLGAAPNIEENDFRQQGQM
jgi:hypothetical protein